MNEKELQEKLEKIRSGMKLFDTMIGFKNTLTDKQVEIVRELFDIFRYLNWQLSFNNYKELKYDGSDPIDKRECGTPVKVRPCDEKYGGKTYFGILIGDIALSIYHKIDDSGTVTATHSMYNPAIFVPELNDIIYGCGSWWSRIENEDDLKKLITDDTIKNVWYMKLLNNMKQD